MFSVMYGESVYSSVLAMGDKSDIGWQFVSMLWSLLVSKWG